MLYRCKKLWKGRVSVRSYIVEYCKKMQEPLIIEFQGKGMRVKDLDDYECDKMPHIAQRSDSYIAKGSVYNLYDYKWNPITKHEEQTGFTRTGLEKLLECWKKSQKEKNSP